MSAAPAMQPRVTAGDRLGLTLFLAIAFHALLILGISFQQEDPRQAETIQTLDVTLVQRASDTPPEKADYVAQEQQRGGGNTQERVRPEPEPTQPSIVEQPAPSQRTTAAAAPPEPESTAPQVLTRKESPEKTAEQTTAPPAPTPAPISAAELMQRSREIARLEARLESARQVYSRNDSKVLTASTRKAEDAAYLNAWIRKVEQIGSLNYPDEARRRNLSGELELEVTLNADGSLLDIKLLRSSGHEVLDEAARRIVRLAAPFAAVPANVLDGDSELRIRRRWRFTTQDQLVGQ